MRLYTSLGTCRNAAIHVIGYLSECGYTRHWVLVGMRLYTSLGTCRYAAIHVIAYLSVCGYTCHCVVVGMRLYTSLRTCRNAAIHVIAYLSECGYTRQPAIHVNRPSGISQAAAIAVHRPQGVKWAHVRVQIVIVFDEPCTAKRLHIMGCILPQKDEECYQNDMTKWHGVISQVHWDIMRNDYYY